MRGMFAELGQCLGMSYRQRRGCKHGISSKHELFIGLLAAES